MIRSINSLDVRGLEETGLGIMCTGFSEGGFNVYIGPGTDSSLILYWITCLDID